MLSLLTGLAQDYNYTYTTSSSGSSGMSAAGVVGAIIYGLVLYLLYGFFLMRIFKKAGKPGWAAFVPFYNTWILLELGGKPGWWVVLACIPIVDIAALVVLILAYVELSKRFGKPGIFAVLLVLLPIIGLPILAFDKSQYNPGVASGPAGPAPTPPQAPPAPPVTPGGPEQPAPPVQPPAQTPPTPPSQPPVAPQV